MARCWSSPRTSAASAAAWLSPSRSLDPADPASQVSATAALISNPRSFAARRTCILRNVASVSSSMRSPLAPAKIKWEVKFAARFGSEQAASEKEDELELDISRRTVLKTGFAATALTSFSGSSTGKKKSRGRRASGSRFAGGVTRRCLWMIYARRRRRWGLLGVDLLQPEEYEVPTASRAHLHHGLCRRGDDSRCHEPDRTS